MRKTILLVGDGNHQFIFYLAKYLKKIDNIQIHLLSFTKVNKEEHYFDRIYHYGSGNLYGTIGAFISALKLFSFFFRNRNFYSVISFQFIRPIYYYLFKLKLLNENHNTVLSVWGSDIMSSSIKQSKIAYILKKAKKTTCATSKIRNEIVNLAPDQNQIRFIKYGLEPLEYIKKITDDSLACKEMLGIDINKFVVTIGHNASPNNQHINCLHEISKSLTTKQLENIIFILPLTYGREMNYVEKLKRIAAVSGLDITFFENYMTDSDVALLRKATDLYINVQVTDMLSGAMQEHIYAGSRVITGRWLDYCELKEIGVNLIEIDAISEIPDMIIKHRISSSNTTNDRSVVYDLSSWNNVINGWSNAFFK